MDAGSNINPPYRDTDADTINVQQQQMCPRIASSRFAHQSLQQQQQFHDVSSMSYIPVAVSTATNRQQQVRQGHQTTHIATSNSAPPLAVSHSIPEYITQQVEQQGGAHLLIDSLFTPRTRPAVLSHINVLHQRPDSIAQQDGPLGESPHRQTRTQWEMAYRGSPDQSSPEWERVEIGFSDWEKVSHGSSPGFSEWEQVDFGASPRSPDTLSGSPEDRRSTHYIPAGNQQHPSPPYMIPDAAYFPPTPSTRPTETIKSVAKSKQTAGTKKRKKFDIQEKLKIIEFVENNPEMTLSEYATHFGIARGTLDGIIKSKDNLKASLNQLPRTDAVLNARNRTEPRSRFVEELLLSWITHIRSQHIPIQRKNIVAQAIAIHRMLSGLFQAPLANIKFSDGWYQEFSKRRSITSYEAVNANRNYALEEEETARFRQILEQYRMDDIYACDATSMFSVPVCTSTVHPNTACKLLSAEDRDQERTSCVFGQAVSIVLFCNATGTGRLDPVMLDRLYQYVPGHYGVRVLRDQDVNRMPFTEWLLAFDSVLERNALLLLSQEVYDQVKSALPAFRYLKVIPAPAHLNALLPMRAGISKHFKAYINIIQFERTLRRRDTYGDTYSIAWGMVGNAAIKQSFSVLLREVGYLEPQSPLVIHELDELQATKDKLDNILSHAHKNMHKSIRQYYFNQDNDIGPSAFLYEEIMKMHKSSDASRYLLGIENNTRPWEEWWKHVVICSGSPL
ncbi:Tigger transposable element-derived protein 6 [Lobosporangium transversale]|nr:Tigger transposable element-derived protein 6 [Lobosporangium transversale]